MNPESPTFEETLYEDSFEYNGDMMLFGYGDHSDTGKMVYVKVGEDQFSRYTVSTDGSWLQQGEPFKMEQLNSGDIFLESAPSGNADDEGMSYSDLAMGSLSQSEVISGTTFGDGVGDGGDGGDDTTSPDVSTSWGADNISKDDFINTDGSPKTNQEIYNILDSKLPGITGKDLYEYINKILPKFEGVDPERQKFLSDEYGIDRAEADRALEASEDVYHLGAGAAGRDRAKLMEQYGLGVSAAERAKETAGDVYGAAEESYQLGKRAAGRQKEAGLGQLQQQAAQQGAQMRSAFGGMGGGMRGAMGGQQTLAKSLGQTYGAYTDKQTALTGAMGRAESAYGRAGEVTADEMTRLAGVQERGLEAVTDEETRLKQQLAGAAETAATAKQRASLAFKRGTYGLEQGAEIDYESLVGGTLQADWAAPTTEQKGEAGFTETSDWGSWRQGGRVPSKETFLDILTKLPDAGGS